MLIKTYGNYVTADEKYNVATEDTGNTFTIVLIDSGHNIVSAFMKDGSQEFSYSSNEAKKIYDLIKKGLNKCNKKNASSTPFKYGVATRHIFKSSGVDYTYEIFNKQICGVGIYSDTIAIESTLNEEVAIPKEIPWVKLTTKKLSTKHSVENEFGLRKETEDIEVRKLEEIALEKDITWLDGKKYYIVNDESIAERLFDYFEYQLKSILVYDVETSGLAINMFGKYGSLHKKNIEEINAKLVEEGKSPYKIDNLVGFIFCVEKDISYYFPCAQRKFKNLYEKDENGNFNEITQNVVDRILAKYKIGEYRDRKDDMANFIRSTPASEWGSDVILMERVRKILETVPICAHNGIYEWKVSWLYNIDLNLKDDTMIMHQLMYKFRSTTSNKGEPSNLKYLTKRELGIDQLDLKDFFIEYEEDNDATARGSSSNGKKGKAKKKTRHIDFSYMDYDGAKAYGPADGDFTYCLWYKYKTDMKKNHSELEYLYQVELIVSCAIAYMEFYGIRLDEERINTVRVNTEVDLLYYEYKFRECINYNSEEETETITALKELSDKIKQLTDEIELYKGSKEAEKLVADKWSEIEKLEVSRRELITKMRELIDNSDNYININAPQQVGDVFYNKLHIMEVREDGKTPVGQKILLNYRKMKNPDGTPKYPIINHYADYKVRSTMLSKFFVSLPDFMYPGGYMFASFGQISTATGRMSCSKPNLQQLPKYVTEIVVPRPNCVMADADFSQIEYRTLVAMAKEQMLIEQFKNPDSDYHTMMAALMYEVPYALVTPEMRSAAKSFNFGIPYGMGFRSLAILLHNVATAENVEDAKIKYEMYFRDQPNVRRFFEQVKESAMVNGYTLTQWKRMRSYSFVDKEGNFSKERMAMALRQAGNAVIQGTAADIYKIAVARVFMFIRDNNLFEKMYICNMVHDEILTEIDYTKLSVPVAVGHLIDSMQYELEGFPPLYVGAGVSNSWKKAKGEMAEIHPDLANQLIVNCKGKSLFTDRTETTEKDVIDYFDSTVYAFRRNKVLTYVSDPKNWNQCIDPAIGKLLGIQFDYGVAKDTGEYCREHNLDKQATAEMERNIPILRLQKFIEENKLDIDVSKFGNDAAQIMDEELDEEYIDDDMGEGEDEESNYESEFALIDESDTLFGIDLRDVIKQFGLVVARDNNGKDICGMHIGELSSMRASNLGEYLQEHECNENDLGALEIVFLKSGNVLQYTNRYVKDIQASKMSVILNYNSISQNVGVG